MANKKTSIGGQALIEGIMMKGPYKTTMAVRMADGSIDLSDVEERHLKDKNSFFGLPIIRGVVNLVEALKTGYGALMKSAEISGFADMSDDAPAEPVEPTEKTAEEAENVEATVEAAEVTETNETDEVTAEAENTEKAEENVVADKETSDKSEKKDKDSVILGFAVTLGSVLGVVLAVVLFMYLPSKLFQLINWLIVGVDLTPFKALIEGLFKIALFVGYIAVVSLEKDIKRVFMYHGAEHKTIFCYEHGDELTVENVKKYTRFHPRCGTSFMFLMIVVGVVIGTLLTFIFKSVGLGMIVDKAYLWVPIKILLIPLTCGLGYELIKICGKHDNIVTRIIAAPGLWVQRLTTKEPDDGMIECAIAAVNEVIPSDGSDEIK